MRLDQNMMRELLKKSDAELWETIVAVGRAKGVQLPERPPGPTEMANLRAALGGASGRMSLAEALRIITQFGK
ncbi:MAG: hypothetical protein WDA00_03450 [Eubacteriales bacterium]